MKIIDKTVLDKPQRFWLNDAKNLVTSLTKFYGAISLEKISQKFDDITAFEKDLLKIESSDELALVREISLSNSNDKFVYARTIVPNNTYKHFMNELESLGTKPIGDNLLFDKAKFDRNEFIIRKLSGLEFQGETNQQASSDIFSRSSVFEYKNNPKLKLLITEYFLILPQQYGNE
ncbi:chorismate--pyruvate lyase family protein [Francisella adeliensis]|uniref:Chorismate lyase n=1 Tax=Francisella adeliensis TaxID=2007306 RepID=A0A2Z4XWM5_9GAMM|nr:chorismate lyase [Francisella adeliensis]AXA33100.1 chorismate--pyruvate lyase [Francisella adeliensis]MBK2086008.1 chorismate lyase [Francisella adeliensis]MBK2096828.1 chorismate lyase [Francisella adeliensis]QIW11330.1 chorismate lyase [Francisella adeliensis]QIW13204.1 chorismate lyase [Francisella adeliensis]